LFKLSLLDPAVLKDLEEDSEEDKAKVGIADNLPREAVKETDFITDNGRRASLLTERASTVGDFCVAVENFVFVNRVLAR